MKNIYTLLFVLIIFSVSISQTFKPLPSLNNQPNTNYGIIPTFVVSPDGNIYASETLNHELFYFNKLQNTWNKITTPFQEDIAGMKLLYNGLLLLGVKGYQNGVYLYTPNSQTSWQKLVDGITDSIFSYQTFLATGYTSLIGGSGGKTSTPNKGAVIYSNSGYFTPSSTWNDGSTGMNAPIGNIVSFTQQPDGDVFAGSQYYGIYRSKDYGKTWQQMDTKYLTTTQPSVNELGTIVSNKDGILFATSYSNGVYRSTDDGATWQQINNGLSDNGVYAKPLLINEEGILFLGRGGESTSYGLYRSTNNGDSWESINTGLTNLNINSLTLDKNGYLYVGTRGAGIFKSEQSTLNLSAKVFEPLPKVDVFRDAMFGGRATIMLMPNDDIIASFIGRHEMYHLQKNATSWTKLPLPKTSNYFALGKDKNNFLLAAGEMYEGIYRSSSNTDYTQLWAQTYNGVTDSVLDINTIFLTSQGTLLAGAWDGHESNTNCPAIFRSTDNGMTWQPTNITVSSFSDIVTFTQTPNGDIFAGSYYHGIYHSSDDGVNWLQVDKKMIDSNKASLWSLNSIISNPQGTLFATCDYGIGRSTDGGKNWEIKNSGITKGGSPLPIIINSQGDIFVGMNSSDGGVYRSKNNGENWELLNTTNEFLYARSLALDSQEYLYVGTGNQGVMKSKVSTLSFPTTKNDNSNIPKTFFLGQNYPNPFNPTTTINYQLPTNNYVTLKVYDILGKEVTTLVNKEMNAGNHNVKFDAAKLSGGIYFYRLTAGSFSETKKLVIIK